MTNQSDNNLHKKFKVCFLVINKSNYSCCTKKKSGKACIDEKCFFIKSLRNFFHQISDYRFQRGLNSIINMFDNKIRIKNQF